MLFACFHTEPISGFVFKIIHAGPKFATNMNEKVEGPRVLLEERRRKNGGKFSLDLEQWTSGPRPPFQRCVEKCI